MKKLQGSYSRFLAAIKYLDEKEVYKRLRFNDKRDIYTRLGFREVHNSTLDKLVKLYPIINKEYLYEGKGKVDNGLKYSKRLSKALNGMTIRNSDTIVKKILKDRYQLLPGPTMDRICSEYNINKNYLLTGKGSMTVNSCRFNDIIKENESIIRELSDLEFPYADCIDRVTGDMSSDIDGGGFNLHIKCKRCIDKSIEIYYYSYINYELYGLKVAKDGKITTKFWKS